MSGFAEHDMALLQKHITSSSPNDAIRNRAIEKLAEVCSTFGPSGVELNDSREAFYRAGADYNNQIQNCCLCGSRYFQDRHEDRIWPLDHSQLLSSVLRVDEKELEMYYRIPSRVHGYLDLTVMTF